MVPLCSRNAHDQNVLVRCAHSETIQLPPSLFIVEGNGEKGRSELRALGRASIDVRGTRA